MKKFVSLLLASVLLFGLSAIPAQAAGPRLRVTAEARAHAARVTFTARTSRPGKVTVNVYKGRTKVRTMTARRSGSTYAVTWNLKNASGRVVAPGVYSYRVSAAAAGARAATGGKVRVPKAPAPAPAPVTDPTAPVTDPAAPAPGSRWIGFYVPGSPASMAPLDALESQLGMNAKVVNFFIADTESFPAGRAAASAGNGSTPMVTLEFWSAQTGGLAAIANGSKDAYLTRFADDARAYGGEVWLRPFHEMNGDWYPWGGTVNGNTPAQYVAAWRHVRDVFTARGATNVKFVWAPNIEDVPSTSANAIENYWPGDAYVDYLALDGYNFGTTATWSSWRSFSSLFGPAYARVTALSGKPLFIAEIGSVEQGGSKAAWITDMFARISGQYTRIQGVCWFNADKEGKDWRVESSSASLSAFRTGAASF